MGGNGALPRKKYSYRCFAMSLAMPGATAGLPVAGSGRGNRTCGTSGPGAGTTSGLRTSAHHPLRKRCSSGWTGFKGLQGRPWWSTGSPSASSRIECPSGAGNRSPATPECAPRRGRHLLFAPGRRPNPARQASKSTGGSSASTMSSCLASRPTFRSGSRTFWRRPGCRDGA